MGPASRGAFGQGRQVDDFGGVDDFAEFRQFGGIAPPVEYLELAFLVRGGDA